MPLLDDMVTITYEDIKNMLQPPLDCSKVGDLRGKSFHNRWILNHEGVDFSGCVLLHCFPSGFAGAVEVNVAPSKAYVSLEDANLEGAELWRAGLSGAYLRGVNFADADLTYANLTNADLSYAYFGGADLKSCKLDGAILVGVTLEGVKNVSLASFRGVKVNETLIFSLCRFQKFKREGIIFYSPNTDFTSKDADFRRDFKRINFSDANLENCNLSEFKLSYMEFRSTNLSRANLEKANLWNSVFQNVDLKGAVLRGANLSDATFEDSDLRGADLRGIDLSEALEWFNVNFLGSDLRGAVFDDNIDFVHMYLENCDLRGFNFQSKDLSRASLERANLQNANLTATILKEANLDYTDLQGADFEGADLQGAFLEDANLRNANFKSASFTCCRLNTYKTENANFADADLSFVVMNESTREAMEIEHPNLKFYPMPMYKADEFGNRRFHKLGAYDASLCPISSREDLAKYLPLVLDYVAACYHGDINIKYDELDSQDKRTVMMDAYTMVLIDSMRFDKNADFVEYIDERFVTSESDQGIYSAILNNPTYPTELIRKLVDAYYEYKNREDWYSDYYWIAEAALAKRDALAK